MKTLLSCEFNMDTACVELKFTKRAMTVPVRLSRQASTVF